MSDKAERHEGREDNSTTEFQERDDYSQYLFESAYADMFPSKKNHESLSFNKFEYKDYDFSSPEKIADSAKSMLEKLASHDKSENFDSAISNAAREGKLPELVEAMNKQLKEQGSDLKFTLDSKIGKYGHREYSVNLFDKNGKLLDRSAAATSPNIPLGDHSQSKDQGLDAEQKISKYSETKMSQEEIDKATEQIASSLLDETAGGKKLDIQMVLAEAQKRGSLDEVLAALNKTLKDRGSDMTVHMDKERKSAFWDVRDADPIRKWDEYKIKVTTGSGDTSNQFDFSAGIPGRSRWGR